MVSYDTMIASVRDILNAGHVNLVETLAERIADRCLIDRRVKLAKVRVEKLDVFPKPPASASRSSGSRSEDLMSCCWATAQPTELRRLGRGRHHVRKRLLHRSSARHSGDFLDQLVQDRLAKLSRLSAARTNANGPPITLST